MSIKKICDSYFPCTNQTVYDTEQKTALELTAATAAKVNELVDEVNQVDAKIAAKEDSSNITNGRKLDNKGNFTGTWFSETYQSITAKINDALTTAKWCLNAINNRDYYDGVFDGGLFTDPAVYDIEIDGGVF